MSRYPWNEKPERYAQLDQERRMTTDHTNSKTPELPPLPAGWRKLEPDEMLSGTDGVVCYQGREGGVPNQAWSQDGRVYISGSAPASVVRHLLGLTAPAADVRAVALEAVAAYDAWDGREKQDGLRRDLAVAMDALEDALTGKGAPL